MPLTQLSVLLLTVLACTVAFVIMTFVDVSRGLAFSAAIDQAQQHEVLALNGLMDADQGLHRYATDHSALSREHYVAGSAEFLTNMATVEHFIDANELAGPARAIARLSAAYAAWRNAYGDPGVRRSTHLGPADVARADRMVDAVQDRFADLNAALAAARQAHGQAERGRRMFSQTLAASGLVILAAIVLSADSRRRREEALNVALLQERAAALERSNAALQDFAYVASHDLQEPLRMISSYTQLLARRYAGRLDADADDFIGYAVDGAKRMQALITDILACSRVSASAAGLVRVDTRRVVAQALANLTEAVAASGAEIRCGELPPVSGEEVQLVQLFQNLIGNALKYRGDEPPRIDVSAQRRGDVWVFAVRDNGIGIAPEYHERIFRMFQRLHAKSEYGGTGIGLAICKRIAERHFGQIWVESTPGQGSTFFFTLRPAA